MGAIVSVDAYASFGVGVTAMSAANYLAMKTRSKQLRRLP